MDSRSFNDTNEDFRKRVFHFFQGFRSVAVNQYSLSVSQLTDHYIFTEQMRKLSLVIIIVTIQNEDQDEQRVQLAFILLTCSLVYVRLG